MKHRPAALNLTEAKLLNKKVPFPHLSALSMAKFITDFDEVSYPADIQIPDPNQLKDGLLRYERSFLLQFMEVCKEKPEGLPDLVPMGLEPNNSHAQENFTMSHGGTGGHKNSSTPVSSWQGSLGLGITGFGKSGQSTFPAMGNFGSGSKLTSDERFAASSRAVSAGGSSYGRPSPMTRTSSQGGVGDTPISSKRVRTKHRKRGVGNKVERDGCGHVQSNAPQPPAEPVAPLEMSVNRWDRKAIGAKDAKAALVDRKVKALLNKLTMKKFDLISDQIVDWVNKSDHENDGRTLMQVIGFVFQMVTDGEMWSELYARLCKKITEKLSPAVRDESIKLQDGKAIAGGQVFHRYLLDRCQDEFEHMWAVREAMAAAKKATEQVKGSNEGEGGTKIILYSNEDYVAQKARRRALGVITFSGELFKLQMLTERIMHMCLNKLLGNVDQLEEEDLESCCKLLMIIGSMLDSPKAANHMMAYFLRLTELRGSPLVGVRVQIMLQDVLDLRENKWVSRNVVAAPSTIAQVHKNGAKEKAARKKDAYSHQISMSRGDSRRGNYDDCPQLAEPKAPEPQRKPPMLAPQMKPTADEVAAKSQSEVELKAEPSSIEMTEEQANKKIEEDLKKFFAVRNLDEAEVYLTSLPAAHHFRLVDKFTLRAIKSKEAEVQLLAEFFVRAVEKELITSEAFEAGFLPITKLIDDIAIDVPKAFTYFATIVKSTGLDNKREEPHRVSDYFDPTPVKALEKPHVPVTMVEYTPRKIVNVPESLALIQEHFNLLKKEHEEWKQAFNDEMSEMQKRLRDVQDDNERLRKLVMTVLMNGTTGFGD